MKLHPVVATVTERIRQRSAPARAAYLRRLDEAASRDRGSDRLGCANVAHAFAALPGNEKLRVVVERAPNIAVVNSYNDMLSAHAPFGVFPPVIKDEALRQGVDVNVVFEPEARDAIEGLAGLLRFR